MQTTKPFSSSIVVAVFVALAASAAAGVSTTGAATTVKSPAVARGGRAVFTANCARCHGADGKSHTSMGERAEAPDLTDAEWQGRRSTARMIASVTNGRGEMPAFKRKLSAQQIAAAVAYVRTLKR